jgi:FKBP-type peptidyl-prolyl cis-trans isomerase
MPYISKTVGLNTTEKLPTHEKDREIKLTTRMKGMKIKLLAFSMLSFASLLAADAPAKIEMQPQTKTDEPTVDRKKVSYALGYNYGKALLKNDKNIDVKEIVKGLEDGLNPTAKGQFDENELQEILMSYYNYIRKVFAEELEKVKEKNTQAGKAFMEANKKKPGVVEDPSGLQYKIIKEGTGPSPSKDDAVEVEIKAKTIDGKVFFDTTVEGQPAQIVVSRVIPGWAIALQKMKQGATWELFVPPNLGYGDKSVSEDIGPESTLVFEVHLLDIKPAHKPAEQDIKMIETEKKAKDEKKSE